MKTKLLNSFQLRLCTLVALVLCAAGTAWGETATYDFAFSTIGSTGWSNIYDWHTVNHTESTVKFNASKQTQTITDYPVTKGQPVTLVMKSGYTLSGVTFECLQWGTKAQTITLHYSVDGGENYTSTNITSTNFKISSSSLPAGTNAVKITFSSSSNQVGIKSASIAYTYSTTPTPSITADNVNLAYDATSGAINYSINNSVSGGKLTAATTSDWLTLGTVGETVPFTCSANTSTERTATVTLTYTYNTSETVTKDVTVTQTGNPNVFNNISDITEVNTAYKVKGTVVATNAKGFVVGDGTGYVYYYKNADFTQSVGDKVTVSGTTGSYGHIIQFTNTATIGEATASNYNNTPVATEITTVPDYTTGHYLSSYLQFEGKLTKNNNTYLITLGEEQIQISYPTSAQGTALTALDGKKVLVKGYFTGINSNDRITIMLESVEMVTDPVINADDVTIAYDATDGEITYTIDNGVTGTALNATLQEGIDWISDITVGSDKITFVTTANEGEEDRTATITLSYEGAEDVTITITQGHYTAPPTEGMITFGSEEGSTKINGKIVTGDDTMGNTWTITTTFSGESTSFTQHAGYSQVGSADNPATSISFTTTLPSETTITSFEAKFGGYSKTAGTVNLKVDDATVGTGSLNGSEEVVVESTSIKKGTVLTVTVTNIAKGVNCYYISYSTTTDPYIVATASETLVHDATTSSISYEVGNPVDGGILTADTEADWISNFTVGESDVTFEVTENTTGEDRSTTVTLTYTYGTSKTVTTDVTVSQHAAPYTLSVSDLSHVNLYVFGDDESEAIINTEEGESSAQVYRGTNVGISLDVETGYVLESLIVGGTDVTAQIDASTGMYEFEMPVSDVTITATAIAPTGDQYALFSGDLVEGDYIIYYNGKAMKNSATNNRLQYEEVTPMRNIITTDNSTIVWHIAPSGSYWTIYSADAEKYAAATGSKNQAQMLADGTDDKALWTVSGSNTYEFENKARAAASSDSNNKLLRNNGTNGFACYATSTGGALSLYKKIETAIETATIPISEYCYDDETEMYYGTYSNESAFVVPEDLTVAEIAIDEDGTLFVEAYKEGTVVPANTGVMVSAAESGEYTVVLSNEDGESVFGEDNCLRPTGNSGIDENAMADADSDCTYYRLTMHNGAEIGFWWGAEDGAAFDLGPNKAYMAVKTGSESHPVKGFALSDFVNGIKAVETTETESNAIYNLAGQRISKMQKGIYIVNGKKVLVK
ncbi:MAG: hypothetical protein IKP44_04415 [Bacteroidaceae bacterium]|nr:hypothetical protein [Bacteroidaceae bacterium]